MSSFKGTQPPKNEETDKGNSEIVLSNIALDLESNNHLKQVERNEDKTSANYSKEMTKPLIVIEPANNADSSNNTSAIETGNADKKEDTDQTWETQSATSPLVNTRSPHNHVNSQSPNEENATADASLLPDNLFENIPVIRSSSSYFDSIQTYVCFTLSTFVALALMITMVLLGYFEAYAKMNRGDRAVLEDPRTFYRLPTDLIPTHYSIDLQPFLTPTFRGRFRFFGNSSVEFKVLRATPYVVVHSFRLKYKEIKVLDDKNNLLQISEYEAFEPVKFLIIRMKDYLKANQKYTLKTRYNSRLSKNHFGFFEATYKKSGENVVVAASQLEPFYAREIFPCFDEPAFKATYDISLWHYPPYIALSNMPILSTEKMHEKWQRTTFQRTLKMSTYILAFIVCDFKHTMQFTKNNIQIRVFAKSDAIEDGKGDLALNLAPRLLNFFQDYLQATYPIPKSDHIAVPEFDLAMENWGLIVYREPGLLFDSGAGLAKARQVVATTISHELAHQWFGNLVTPLWWNDLWLNEGFSTYFQYLGLHYIEPDWKMMDEFLIKTRQSAMEAEEGTKARTVVPPNPNTDDDVWSSFKSTVYTKGACMVRMIHGICGEKAFKLALKNYLNTNAYQSVFRKLLYQELENAIQETNTSKEIPVEFEKHFEPWLTKVGYPVVTMTRIRSTDKIMVSEVLYQARDDGDTQTNFQTGLPIPIWYYGQGDSEKRLTWLIRNELTNEIRVPLGNYFIGNYEVFGYYQVNYDLNNWFLIAKQLKEDHTAIEVKTRGNLLYDAYQHFKKSLLPVELILNLTEFTRNDIEYITWAQFNTILTNFSSYLRPTSANEHFQKYVSYLIERKYDDIGWNDDGSHVKQKERQNVIKWACQSGVKKCSERASFYYKSWLDSGQVDEKVPIYLRSEMFCFGIKYGGEKEWQIALERRRNITTTTNKQSLEDSLTCTRMPSLITGLMQMWLKEKTFKPSNPKAFITKLCSNAYVQKTTFQFILGNYSSANIMLALQCAQNIQSEISLQELDKLKEEISEDSALVDEIQFAIEKIELDLKWLKKFQTKIENWLKDKLRELQLL